MTDGMTELSPGYSISRLLKGGWQLAGGHGPVDAEAALADMQAYVDAGITTFDCADIYTGVEARIGEFLRRLRGRSGSAAASAVQLHTKCVPDLDRLPALTKRDVRAIIDRSLARLGVERLDLVQLHWWDYAIPGVVEAAQWLDELRRDGKIRLLGLTNVNSAQLATILRAGVPVVAHQLQYSVLDCRPAGAMTACCTANGVRLLAYGALAGGFLSERWLGRPDPAGALENRSLVKYRLIIDEFGGWNAFQELLGVLGEVARRHDTTIGAVAIRWVLDRPHVAGVIVGARHARHLPATVAALNLDLDDEDRAVIARVHASHPGPAGDVYDLERLPGGRHASIMRYNLNRAGTVGA
jgi:aryl-alcohol dehydrogenase-like predicted oxidoreductase